MILIEDIIYGSHFNMKFKTLFLILIIRYYNAININFYFRRLYNDSVKYKLKMGK